jgi:hypothetical protein
VGFPFNLLVHTMGRERLKSPFRLAGAATRGGHRWWLWTTVQSSAMITFSKGNVDGGRTGILRPAALRSDGGRAGLIAGDETPATIPDDSSRTRPHARSLTICVDFLRQRLSALEPHRVWLAALRRRWSPPAPAMTRIAILVAPTALRNRRSSVSMITPFGVR